MNIYNIKSEIEKEIFETVEKPDKSGCLPYGKEMLLTLIFYKFISQYGEDVGINVPEGWGIETLNSNPKISYEFLNELIERLEFLFSINEELKNFSYVLDLEDIDDDYDYYDENDGEYVPDYTTSLEDIKEEFDENADFRLLCDFALHWFHKIEEIDKRVEGKDKWERMFYYTLQCMNQIVCVQSFEYATPKGVEGLIAELIFKPSDKDENIRIYDPVLSTGTLLSSLLNKTSGDVSVCGLAIERRHVVIAKMQLILNGSTDNEIVYGSSLTDPAFTKDGCLDVFDYVVSNQATKMLNFTNLLSTQRFKANWDQVWRVVENVYADEALIMHFILSIKDGGMGALLVEDTYLAEGISLKMRNWLIENNCVEAIIELPEGLVMNHTKPTLLLLTNKQSSGDVFVVDGSKCFTKEEHGIGMSSDDIHLISYAWKKKLVKNNFSRIVSANAMENHGYSFQAKVYLLMHNYEVADKGYKYVPLRDFLKPIERKWVDDSIETGRLIDYDTLKDDPVNFYISPTELSEENLHFGASVLEENALLIINDMKKLNPSYCYASHEAPLYFSPSLSAFTVSDAVNLNYLIKELHKDYVKEQVKAFYTNFFYDNYSISEDSFLNVRVKVPVGGTKVVFGREVLMRMGMN